MLLILGERTDILMIRKHEGRRGRHTGKMSCIPNYLHLTTAKNKNKTHTQLCLQTLYKKTHQFDVLPEELLEALTLG